MKTKYKGNYPMLRGGGGSCLVGIVLVWQDQVSRDILHTKVNILKATEMYIP